MLHKATLHFLEQLATNNSKEWFDANRSAYMLARADFEALVAEIINQMGNVDTTIIDLTPKQCIFRLNRDVRFSANKSPYKTNFGASFEQGGRKSGLAGYYLHIEPGNKSMVGGGIWLPEAEHLRRIRQEIDYNWEEFKSLLQEQAFKKVYADLDHSEHKLKREPKGYEPINPAIEYLKLKSLIAIHTITDADITSEKLLPVIIQSFAALKPLVYFVNRSLS